jgi:hypothetical protein
MDDRISLVLWNPQQAYQEIQRGWGWAKAMLMAGHRLILEIRLAKRTDEQNKKFHAICGDLAKSGLPWAGKPRKRQQWKVLLVSGHAKATGEEVEIVPGLEGEFINIRESTALMSKARGSSLIEYSIAFCVTHDVLLSAESRRVDPETGEILEAASA